MNTAILSAKAAMLRALPSTARTRAVRMANAEVIRLDKKSGVKSIEVIRGIVWLTGTPADGDIILQEDDRFVLSTSWPYVLQALNEAEIVLRSA